MFRFYLTHFNLVKKSGIFFPFVLHHRLQCFIHPSARLELKGRVYFGNKKLLKLSAIASNLQAAKQSRLITGSSVSIGPGVNLILKDHATLEIGDDTYFTSDCHIEAVKRITIGARCAISWGVTMIDDDHHELMYEGRKEIPSEVVVGNEVWIGCNTTLLKGTSIGDGSVVAAGSVVRGVFGKNCLIGGNPAKVLRENIQWK